MTSLFGVFRPLNAPGFNVKDFGAKGDGATDDIAAFEAAITAMNVTGASVYSRGRELIIPYGTYRLSRALHIDWGMLVHGAGFGETSAASRLVFDSGVHGVIFDSTQSSASGRTAAWSEMRNVYISAAGKGVANKHGVILRARAKIENVIVGGFSGNGIHIVAGDGNNVDGNTPWTANTAYTDGDWVTNGGGNARFVCVHSGTSASSGGPTGTSASIADGSCIWKSPVSVGSPSNYMGNANNTFLGYCRVTDCGGHGVYYEGDDANAGVSVGLDLSVNTGWGIYDKSFLGNTHYAAHAATNTAGPYKTASHGNCYAMFSNCYSESDQTGSDIYAPGVVHGGLHAAGFLSSSTGFRHIGAEMTSHSVGNTQSSKTLTATLGRSSEGGGILSALEAVHTDDATGFQLAQWDSATSGWSFGKTNYPKNLVFPGGDGAGHVQVNRLLIKSGTGASGAGTGLGMQILSTNGHPLTGSGSSIFLRPGDIVMNQHFGTGGDTTKFYVANQKCGAGPAWTSGGGPYYEGATVTPSTPNAYVYRQHTSSTSTTSGAIEPTWPTTPGQTVAESTGLVWECWGIVATSGVTAL